MPTARIVVADDSATVRTRVQRILMAAGFEVDAAANGREALELMRGSLPALAIIDINMPELDGYGICQELRDLGAPWDAIPIVFLTAVKSHALEILGEEMGAYLHKPIQPDRLLNTVSSLIESSPTLSGEAR